MKELTVTEVMRNPVVSYTVYGHFPDEERSGHSRRKTRRSTRRG